MKVKGVIVEQKDFYDPLKFFCIKFNDSRYKFGVQGFYIYPKSDLMVAVIAPEKLYDLTRKYNEYYFDPGHIYEYVIDYKIYKLLNSKHNPCKEDLSWREDSCKIENLAKSMASKYNCTVPWLLRASKYNEVS